MGPSIRVYELHPGKKKDGPEDIQPQKVASHWVAGIFVPAMLGETFGIVGEIR